MSEEYARALTLMDEGRHGQARQLLQDAIAQRSGDLQLRLALGRCLVLMSEHRAAEDQLRLVVANLPQNPSAWYHLGVSLQAQSRLDEAADAYRRALQIENHADAWERLAQCERPTVQSGQVLPAAPPATLAASIAQLGTAEEGSVQETLRPRWRHFCLPAVVATLFTIGVLCTGQSSSLVSPLDVLLPLGLAGYCGFAWVAVALQATRNRYVLYQRRLDLNVGVLDQQAVYIWLFEITGARAVRGPLSALTNTASVEVDYKQDLTARLEGIGDFATADRVAKLLTRRAAEERRDMKGILIT
ncbi:tetratricopeptide repeat protein [Allorhizocola rhizosphaerae]|uniref:tetratricopeptide repeat protein n=1 Tax=Allorhizocola rhizosphaerae TaxID=1872709 RepID=UPI000E3E8CF9|nr:tetratricopeptide repeat protein [Allorhizocola rhizosphaerae]